MLKKTISILILMVSTVLSFECDLSFYLPQFILNGVNYYWDRENGEESMYFDLGVASDMRIDDHSLKIDISFLPPLLISYFGIKKTDNRIYNIDMTYNYNLIDTSWYNIYLGVGYNYRSYLYFINHDTDRNDIYLYHHISYVSIDNEFVLGEEDGHSDSNTKYLLCLNYMQKIGFNETLYGSSRIGFYDRFLTASPGDVTFGFYIDFLYNENIFDLRYYSLITIRL